MNQFSLSHTSIGKVIALVHADPGAGIATFAAYVPFVRKRPQIASKSIIFCLWINNEQVKHIWYWKTWYNDKSIWARNTLHNYLKCQ